jgi:hypothetical protein
MLLFEGKETHRLAEARSEESGEKASAKTQLT